MKSMSALEAWYSHNLRGFSAILGSLIDSNKGQIDPSTYHEAIRAAIEQYNVVSPEDVERKFDVSLSAVGRWKNGQSVPHPALRPIVLQWVREKADLKAGSQPISREDFRSIEAVIFDGHRLVID